MINVNGVNFKLGDVFRVLDYGCCYTSYTSAKLHFGLDSNYICPRGEKRKEINWILVGIAIHGRFQGNYIGLFRNCYGHSILVDLNSTCSFQKRHLPSIAFREAFKEKNKNYKIRKICDR